MYLFKGQRPPRDRDDRFNGPSQRIAGQFRGSRSTIQRRHAVSEWGSGGATEQPTAADTDAREYS